MVFAKINKLRKKNFWPYFLHSRIYFSFVNLFQNLKNSWNQKISNISIQNSQTSAKECILSARDFKFKSENIKKWTYKFFCKAIEDMSYAQQITFGQKTSKLILNTIKGNQKKEIKTANEVFESRLFNLFIRLVLYLIIFEAQSVADRKWAGGVNLLSTLWVNLTSFFSFGAKTSSIPHLSLFFKCFVVNLKLV